MKKFIYTKDLNVKGMVITNNAVNMDLVSCFFKQDWELENFTRFDITFKIDKGSMNWSFVDEIERDRVFNEIKEDFSYEI